MSGVKPGGGIMDGALGALREGGASISKALTFTGKK